MPCSVIELVLKMENILQNVLLPIRVEKELITSLKRYGNRESTRLSSMFCCYPRNAQGLHILLS